MAVIPVGEAAQGIIKCRWEQGGTRERRNDGDERSNAGLMLALETRAGDEAVAVGCFLDINERDLDAAAALGGGLQR